MRPISPDHPNLGRRSGSPDLLSAFRALPHLDALPATAFDAPGAEVRLLDDALNLPDGGFLTMTMVHSRLSQPSRLVMDLLDRGGRRRSISSLRMEPEHVEVFGQALRRFEAAAHVPMTAHRRTVGC